ncbi:MAG TPA: hypothetical protein VHR35_17815 [Nocardioides sp.]|jgi:hypothetical protein|nr:hypothetical protein [Nocardioides sp.]
MTAEDLLTRTLREVTEDADYPTTPLADVRARAGAVRARSRRTAMLAAAAAVALVAGSTALWVSRSPDSSPSPSHELSSGPTTEPTGQTSQPPVLARLAFGHKPGIDYLHDVTYVDMNGGHTTDPALRTAFTATPVRGGLLFTVPETSPDLARLWVHSPSGDQSLGCGSKRFAMSTDGTQTAYWVMDSCTPGSAGKLYDGADNTMAQGGPGFVRTPAGEVIEPVGIQTGSIVVNAWHGQHPTAEVIDAYTGKSTALSALRLVTGSDENNRVVSGEVAGDRSQSAVVDARTGEVYWRSGWQLGQFSDNGKYVIGMRSGSGLPDSYAVFDATSGHKVCDLPPWGPGWIRQVAWDFDDTVLAVADAPDGEAIVRFDLQGRVTRATPIGHQTQTVQVGGYRLATRP